MNRNKITAKLGQDHIKVRHDHGKTGLPQNHPKFTPRPAQAGFFISWLECSKTKDALGFLVQIF
ncbi:MAG: hypothetical protein GXY42_07140 [Desulfovibrionales bacterium]|nr:hypothetical protein [Desulfovibrionales bacterium]